MSSSIRMENVIPKSWQKETLKEGYGDICFTSLGQLENESVNIPVLYKLTCKTLGREWIHPKDLISIGNLYLDYKESKHWGNTLEDYDNIDFSIMCCDFFGKYSDMRYIYILKKLFRMFEEHMEELETSIYIYGIDKPKLSIPQLINMGIDVVGVKNCVKKRLGIRGLSLKDCRDVAVLYLNVLSIYYEYEWHHISIEGMDDIEKIIEIYELYDVFEDDDRSIFRTNPEYVPIIVDEFMGMM